MLQLIPTIVQSTVFDAFSGKEFVDADGLFAGFYVVATGPVGWRGADIYYSADSGATWTIGGHIGNGASFGITNSALTNGATPLSIDTTDTLDVQLYNDGSLATCSANDLANGVNAALVGGELVSFLNVAAGSSNLEFLLTTITRGQRSTNTSGHVIGERFWLLNSAVARVSVSQSLIGDSILVVAIGYGQNITDADVSPVSVIVASNNYPYVPMGAAGVPTIQGQIMYSANGSSWLPQLPLVTSDTGDVITTSDTGIILVQGSGP